MGNAEIIDAFCSLVTLRPTVKDLPVRIVSAGNELSLPLTIHGINDLTVIDFSSRLRLASALRGSDQTEKVTLEDILLILCAQAYLCMTTSAPGRPGTGRGFPCSMTIGCNKCGPDTRRIKIRWVNDDGAFLMRIHRICLCCVAARCPMPAPPCQTFDLLLVRTSDLDCNLPSEHPARELGHYFLRYDKCPFRASRESLRLLTASRTQLSSQITMFHCQDFDTLVSSLNGYAHLQTLAPDPEDASMHPLELQGANVVTFTWLAPWIRAVLTTELIQYFDHGDNSSTTSSSSTSVKKLERSVLIGQLTRN
jgi:hypothetical protein